MNVFGIGIKLDKNLFFDRKAVSDAVAKANKKTLGKAGALLRRHARQSMRRRNKPSPPGTPPSAHGKSDKHPRGALLKERLFYQYDPATDSVIVGPQKLGRSDAPSNQEFGGPKVIKVRPIIVKTGRKATPLQRDTFKRKIKDGSIVRIKQPMATKSISLPARPYMKPALLKELPKFPSLYAGQITGS
jgi:hypothetical protein